ncbi:LicD family protein [Helcococcus ovis]|uniref:LicD family protein n=1 Tax=Helcococcus ovis TaxID=72026 RepID=A0A4R9C1X9_9FIRM|nr:LicD family protein [Helcococcus ovis]TFF64112.1 LicD family protein [Helcococcus ovis]TFF66763.1 LicD family protein [Helcococcus ovis]TFF68212.1 LicD family protein [Helcococcus ovis]WNZ01513.1 LicD family protein [Helcococcus ovis]
MHKMTKLQKIELEILKKIDEVCKKHNIKYWIDSGTLLGAVRHKGFIPWDDDIDIAMLREDYEKFLKVAQKDFGNEYFLQTKNTDKKYPLFYAKVRKNNTSFVEWAFRGLNMHHGIYVDVFIFDTLPLENTEKYVEKCIKLNRQGIRKYVPTVNKKPTFSSSFIIGWLKKKLARILFMFIPAKIFDEKINNEFTKYANESYNNKKLACLSFNDPYYFYENNIFPTKTLKFEDYEFPVPNNYDEHLKTYYGEYMEIPPVEKRETHSVKLINFEKNY